MKTNPSEYPVEVKPAKFNWSGNSSIQNLLDSIVSIITEEYVETARLNPEVFKEIPVSRGITTEQEG